MELHETLDKAADVMTERGQAKRTFKDPIGRVCLVGAIAVALGYEANDYFPVRWETRFCNVLFGKLHDENPDQMPAITWNDQPETTEGEVIDFLRQAAIAAKEASK